MPVLAQLLDTYRAAARTEREKGTYFEELIACYLRTEPSYRDLYSDIWTYSDWEARPACWLGQQNRYAVKKVHSR